MIAQARSYWQFLVAGLGGGGTIVGLVGRWTRRGQDKADEVATIVTSAGETVKLSTGLLATYVTEVAKLTERVARLEGLLDQRDRDNRWLSSRVRQLEDTLTVHGIAVPAPPYSRKDPQ